MNKLLISTVSIIGLLLAGVIGLYLGLSVISTEASVVAGNEYNSTTTSATFQNHNVLKTGWGSLAQVTITGTNPGTVTLYDATTTNSALRTKPATTTIANFQTTATPGTYTFDVVFNDGLLVDFGGGTGSTTIMWR